MLYTAVKAAAVVVAISHAAPTAALVVGSPAGHITSPWAAAPPRAATFLSQQTTEEDCGCESAAGALTDRGVVVPSSSGSVFMNDVAVSGASLRSMVLADVAGERMAAETLIGTQGKAVVVFLRHLG